MEKDFDNLSLEESYHDVDGNNLCRAIDKAYVNRKGTMVIFFNDCLDVHKIAIIDALRFAGYMPSQDLANVLGKDIVLYEMC